MNNSNLQLSILIVTYNSEKYISNCIDSILSQNPASITYEILVVDNCSNDKTSDIVKSKFPAVRYFQNSNNLGFAKAVNQSFQQINGEYILLLNPDTVIVKDFFLKLSNLFKHNNKIDILGVKLLNEQGSEQPSSWKKVTFFTILLEMLLPYQLSKKLVTVAPKQFCEVENVSGACMLIKKDVFEKLSGFDEKFFLYYEEIDFCRRAKNAGYKINYTPDIEVIHFGAKSSITDKQVFFYNLYKNKLYFIKKHYGKIFFNISFIVVVIGILLRIIFGFIGGLFLLNKDLYRISQTLILVLIRMIKNDIR